MKLNRNPEIARETVIYIVVTAAAAVCGFFLTGRKLSGLLIVLITGLVLTLVHYLFAAGRYARIAKLSESLDRILHGQQTVLIEDSSEGELSILNSEVHKMTIRLKEQADQLAQSKLNLTDAIADIFHQLRTPLTSMNLTVSLLAEENLPYEKRIRHARSLKQQLERISWLVESLLKMSRIDSGTAVFRPEHIKASALLERASQPFLVAMELRGQEYRTFVSDEGVDADPAWTVEAFGNLLKNCMEHTPAGGRIEVSVSETPLFTEFIVRDTGEGFVPEDIPHLFERFYKGQNASEGSIGIGLALSRMIISAQNGTITADNAPEGGARFTVRFYKTVI